MKDQLIFDVTDADTIADSDSVGAFVRSSDGTLITHTTSGGKEALDVNIAASDISIDVDLDHTEDSVRLGDGTSFFTSTSENGDVALDVHLSNSSIAVTATDLDIRDLTFGTDSVDVSGSSVSVSNAAGASAVNIQDGGNSITVDAADLDIRDLAFATDSVDVSGSSVTVSATDLDIRDLSASTDSVSIGDGTDTLAIEADGSINVNVASIQDAALANTAIAAGASVQATANTAVDVVASPLSDRKYLFAYNNDNRKMYIGPSGVTTANGFPVSPGSYLELRAGDAIDIEFVSAKAGHALRYLELS